MPQRNYTSTSDEGAALAFNVMQDQPAIPFVEIEIRGALIPLLDYVPPQQIDRNRITPSSSIYFLSMVHERTVASGGAGQYVTFDLLDLGWDKLENTLLQIMNQEVIRFRYGWRRPNEVLQEWWHEAVVLDWTPTFQPFQGARVSITCSDRGWSLGRYGLNFSFNPGQKISDVIRIIIEQIDPNLVLEIEPTSNSVEELNCMNNMTPAEYIRVLLEKATSASSGKSNYLMYTRPGEDGRTRMFIVSDDWDTQPPYKTYVFGRDRVGEMLMFQPRYQAAQIIQSGGPASAATYIDPDTKAQVRLVSTSAEDGLVVGTNNPLFVENRPNRIQEYPHSSMSAVNAQLSHARARNGQAVFEAVATTMGDPGLQPLDKIGVLVLKNGPLDRVKSVNFGDLHHTSGLYKIFQVTNTIQAGRFTSTVQMQRTGSKIGQNPAGEIVYVATPTETRKGYTYSSGVVIHDINEE